MNKKLLSLLILIPASIAMLAFLLNDNLLNVQKPAIISNTDVFTTMKSANDHKDFVQLLNSAQDTSELTTHKGPYTIFAPTDTALQKQVGAAKINLASATNFPLLTALTHNHIVLGRYRTKDLTDGMILTTIQGSKLTFTKKNGDWYINGTSKIISPETITKNGIIYSVNGVLDPTLQ